MFLRAAGLLGLAGALQAQTVRISGTVVDDRQAPVAGATVRLTGDRSASTRANGRFDFADAIPGHYLITVTAIGHQLRTIDVSISRDTALTVVLTRRSVTLDTMIVRPRNLRVRVTAADSATGDALMQAQATLYPGSRFIGAMSGTVTFDSVSPGPTTIVIEAYEHLPRRIELDLARDTAFRVRMAVDSVALRMTAMQVRRIERRTQSIAMPTTSVNREAIERDHVAAIGDLIDRRSYGNIDSLACYFVDDFKAERAEVSVLLPELVERVELFRRGGAEVPKFSPRGSGDRNFGKVVMIRVYTRRYVATLPRHETLPKVAYMQNGTKPICG